MFFAIFESVIFANGLSAPQHSTYFVIFDDGRDLVGGPPGVAKLKLLEEVGFDFIDFWGFFFFSCKLCKYNFVLLSKTFIIIYSLYK